MSKVKTVYLPVGFDLNGKKIKEVHIRKPVGGDLRGGVKLQDLYDQDPSTLKTILARVTTPLIEKAVFDTLEIEDVASLGMGLLSHLEALANHDPLVPPSPQQSKAALKK